MTEYNTHNLPGTAKKQRTRLFALLRIIDNRLQALAPSDPEDRDSEPEWTDLGSETLVWSDRETAFQIGRANGGLLVSVDGIPGGHRIVAFHKRVREIREEAGDYVSSNSAPASGDSEPSQPEKPEAMTKAQRDAENRAKVLKMKQERAAKLELAQQPAEDDQVPY